MNDDQVVEQALKYIEFLARYPAYRGPMLADLERQLEAPGHTPLKALVVMVHARGWGLARQQTAGASMTTDATDKKSERVR